MSIESADQRPCSVVVRLQPTYRDGPVVVTLRHREGASSSPERVGFFTEFALRRRLAKTQKRTPEQINEVLAGLLHNPNGFEFSEEGHGSWPSALDAWNGVGTPSQVRAVTWSCRNADCPAPVQRTLVAALPDQVILLRCEACGTRCRIDPTRPERGL